MISWSLVPTSGLHNADGFGRYYCYTTYNNNEFINQIVFGYKRIHYSFSCDKVTFGNTICKCFYDPTKAQSVLCGGKIITEINRIISEIKSNKFCVILLSSWFYQQKENRHLLYDRFVSI